MNVEFEQVKEIFLAALEREAPHAREAYLSQACAANEPLRRQVEALLHRHEQAGSFLEAPPSDLPSPGEEGDGPAVAATFGQPITERPGAVIGPYKLLEQIGEGGFGAVFVAEQQQPLRRRVALKVIKPGMDTRQVIARFEAERQALALMDHPNIARVLDAGTTASGRPYFVMELVKGVPVTQFCDENRLTPRQRLELFTHVCHAVQHAHHKGIIHRDIKPTNVMVTSHDGTPVVKVIDFGVAKAIGQQLNERTIYTALSQMIGTPLYMSPEQAGMSGLDVDTRTDIYSLGVLLYELLTGTTPFGKERFQQAAYDEIRRIIREEDPPKPSTRLSDLGKCGDGRPRAGELSWTSSASAPARLAGPTSSLASLSALRHTEPAKLTKLVHGELDWLVMKALDKDRNRRYETANGFALDVQRYLANEPVQACPPSAGYRFRKFARRNKGGLMTVAIVGLSLLLGTGISTWQAIRATRAEVLAGERFEGERKAREQAEDAQTQAISQRDLARRRQFDARLAQAKAGRHSGTVGQRVESLKAIEEAVDLARELEIDKLTRVDLRNEAIACLGLTDVRLVRQWQARTSEQNVPSCYDSRLEHYAYCDLQGTVSVRRIADDQEVGQLTAPKRINYEVRFSPDGNLLAALEHTGASAPLVWDWRKNTQVFQFPHADYVSNAVCFSPDSQLLAVARTSRVVSIFRLATGEEIGKLNCGAQPYHVSFSPDGRKLAVASYHQQSVQIHDVETGEVKQKWSEPSGPWGVAWHPESQMVAVWSNDFRIHLWNAVTGRELSAWQGHVTSTVVHAEFDAIGNRLLTWAWDGTTRLWDPWSGRELVQLPGILSQFSRDGKTLLSSRGGRFLLWEVGGGEEYRSLPNWELPSAADVQNIASRISPDGRWLVLGCTNGMRLLDLARNQPVGHFFTGRRIVDVAFHPSGRELLVCTTGDVQRLPFVLEQDVLRIGPPTQVAAVAVHGLNLDRTGKVLSLARLGGSLLVHLDRPEAPPHRLRVGDNYNVVSYAAVSPDGRWAATGNHVGAGAQVWDAATGTLVKGLLDDPASIGMAFSPDGKQLVTASATAVILWETETWKEQRRIALGGEAKSGAVWDGQGKLFGFHSTVRSFELQDPATGQTYATLHAPDHLPFGGARFTPAGDRLVTDSARPSHIRVWDLRLVRQRLAAMGLDWDAPPYDPVDPKQPEPVRLEVELENPAQKAVRAKQDQGDEHRVQKEYAQAIACYREVLNSEPHNADVLNRAAWLLAIGPPEVRDGQEALKFMERARPWEPTSAYYVNTLGAAQYRAGQHAEALRSSRQAERELGDNKVFTWPHNWLVQALCLAKLGQRDAASAAYQKSVEWLKDPGPRNTVDRKEAELLRSEVEALLKQ